MNLHPDDPRLTAYALGEMPENERAAFESELRRSPECRAVVEEIRRTANLIEGELASEPVDVLSEEQRARILKEVDLPNVIRVPTKSWYAPAGLSALAACLALVIAWQAGFFTPKPSQAVVALNEMPIAVDSTNSAELVTRVLSASEPDVELVNGPRISNLAEPEGSSAVVLERGQPVIAPAESATSFDSDLGIDTSTGWSDLSSSPAQSQNVVTVSPPRQATAPPRPVGSGSYSIIPRFEAGSAPGEPQSQAAGGTRLELAGASVSQLSGEAESEAARGIRYSRSSVSEQQIGGRGGVVTYGDSSVRDGFQEGRQPGRSGRVVTDPRARDDYEWSRRERLPLERGYAGTSATYPRLVENSFLPALDQPLSTFSIDVDTASYSNVRRFLNSNRLPPTDAARVEEMINYFRYDYPQPKGDDPFSAQIEVAGCPWEPEHRLVRVGLKGREIAQTNRPPSNFVFLIDVSGSMQPSERLPLIKQALRQLVKRMTENDRVAIVVYASSAGVRLPSTSCVDKEKILRAIDELEAGGSTNGGDGIQQAYRVAEENFIREGVNRVLLCTDGDFNVGMTDQEELVRMIQRKARSGVFLTTLGVGTDNYKDALIQKLADRGNGNYYYLDTLEEAHKVLIEQMNGTLVTIAKDVKIQIEFNPARVAAYRLIGYEKRLLRTQDFNNDAKDAGEIGAGHTVTALYEIVPAGRSVPAVTDGLKYQRPALEERPERYATLAARDNPRVITASRELLTLNLRYKQPDGDVSRLLEFPVIDDGRSFASASTDFRFAAAVASFGMLLRGSEHAGSATFGSVLEIATESKGIDPEGYRAEFLNLVRKARELQRR